MVMSRITFGIFVKYKMENVTPRSHNSLGKMLMSFLLCYLRSRLIHYRHVDLPTVCKHITPPLHIPPLLFQTTPHSITWLLFVLQIWVKKAFLAGSLPWTFWTRLCPWLCVAIDLNFWLPRRLSPCVIVNCVLPKHFISLCDSELCIFSVILWALWNRGQRLSCSPGHNGKMPKWRSNTVSKQDSQCSFGSQGI